MSWPLGNLLLAANSMAFGEHIYSRARKIDGSSPAGRPCFCPRFGRGQKVVGAALFAVWLGFELEMEQEI